MPRPKPVDNRTNSKSFPIIVTVLVLIAIVVAVFTFKGPLSLWWSRKVRDYNIQHHPPPTPTPRPVGHGKIEFSVSQGNRQGPRFSNGYFDPLDPAPNTKQTIAINVSGNAPVTSVYGIMISDHKQQQIPFKLVSGTATQGTWQGTWIVNDTYSYNYEVDFHADNSDGTDVDAVQLR